MDLAGLHPALAIGGALAAGAASFLSPCVAPLLPGYLAFIGGDVNAPRGLVIRRALGFVAGFTMLFALLGATAASLSASLLANRSVLELASGLLVALLGVAVAFDRHRMLATGVSARAGGWARGDSSSGSSGSTGSDGRTITGVATAMPVGAAFAVAWTPCIGPVLAAVLTIAAGGGHPAWGATLLAVYGIGLGLPFIAGAVALTSVARMSRRARTHARGIRVTSGLLLVVVGVAMATGSFGAVTAHLARAVPSWLP